MEAEEQGDAGAGPQATRCVVRLGAQEGTCGGTDAAHMGAHGSRRVAGNEAADEYKADATAKAAAAGDDYETQRYDQVARETYEEYRGKSPPGQQTEGA